MKLLRLVHKIIGFFLLQGWHNYHLVDARSELNGYKGEWCDRDRVMLFCCFNILKEYVEKEQSPEWRDLVNSTPEQYVEKHGGGDPGWVENDLFLGAQHDTDREIMALYAWWTGGRKAEHGAVDRLYNQIGDMKGEDFLKILNTPRSQAWKAWSQALMDLDTRDDDMLKRLMNVRSSLWT